MKAKVPLRTCNDISDNNSANLKLLSMLRTVQSLISLMDHVKKDVICQTTNVVDIDYKITKLLWQ